ncbi:MAG TPA: SHOCT domain-containing protein [Anaerolineales bacterium]|nr:SHOCT domain-containing protein [Anaerolineales bacterium]
MEKKNPLLAGLLNMLVPGSGYWYVNQDGGRFIRTLIFGIAAVATLIILGNIIQNTAGFPLPQGLCVGILLLIVLVPLFLKGQKVANHHNLVLNNTTQYTERQHGNNEAQLAKNEDLRNKGLISKQEYDRRKDNITSKQ